MGMSTDIKSQETSSKGTASNADAKERPPSYTQEEELLLNFPTLNLSDTKKLPSQTSTVTRDQCVAHLKFLAVLADLRDTVSNTDGLFGIFDKQSDFHKDFLQALNESRARIREKRWAIYTARAVERYRKWWFTCVPTSRPPVTISELESPEYETILDSETQVSWSEDNLPPLGESGDISMIV
jgi:hypothetical protein